MDLFSASGGAEATECAAVVAESVAPIAPQSNLKGGSSMQRKNILKLATAAVVLTALCAVVYAAQDKYSLISPGGIAFSDFKGYEDWSMVSSAHTSEVLKVIVANPAMIAA